MSMFAGKVALVTGATSGIGRATAIAFVKHGAKVVAAGRREDEGQKTVRQVKDAGGDGLFVKTDVSRAADVEALIAATVRAYGRLDFAFNNAGVDEGMTSIVDETEADYDRIMTINVKGVWLCIKHEVAQMLKNGGGSIVNTSSVAGLVGMPVVPLYTASKHAVIGLTRSAALAYAKSSIRVNAVCPGAVDTEMTGRFFGDNEQLRQAVMSMHPVGRIGTAEEIASAVVWLCSPQAGFVTGHALAADGGYTAQ